MLYLVLPDHCMVNILFGAEPIQLVTNPVEVVKLIALAVSVALLFIVMV